MSILGEEEEVTLLVKIFSQLIIILLKIFSVFASHYTKCEQKLILVLESSEVTKRLGTTNLCQVFKHDFSSCSLRRRFLWYTEQRPNTRSKPRSGPCAQLLPADHNCHQAVGHLGKIGRKWGCLSVQQWSSYPTGPELTIQR